jgi:hypothetical protein
MHNLKYSPINPDWFYSYLDIPNLEIIRQELIVLVNSDIAGYRTNPTAYNIDGKTVMENCPELEKYLKGFGIDKIFHRLLISRKMNNDGDKMVHVDSYDPRYAQKSLNIGLIDYEGSYTSWHKTDVQELYDSAPFGFDPVKNFAFIEVEKTQEIGRLVYDNRAAMINTTVLHKGNAQKDTRIIAGMRFVPELDEGDLRRMGIEQPYIQ